MSWTDEQVTRLGELRKSSVSFARATVTLNNEFGTNFTRNAVIGKAHRSGYFGIKPPAPPTPSRPRPRRTQEWRPRPRRPPLEVVLAEAPDKPPPGFGCTLQELTAETCRWPHGDPIKPGFYFCGAQIVDGFPYCAAHVRAAYLLPPQALKRDEDNAPPEREKAA